MQLAVESPGESISIGTSVKFHGRMTDYGRNLFRSAQYRMTPKRHSGHKTENNVDGELMQYDMLDSTANRGLKREKSTPAKAVQFECMNLMKNNLKALTLGDLSEKTTHPLIKQVIQRAEVKATKKATKRELITDRNTTELNE